MSLPTIQDMQISTAERLEFEAIKSEKLQYFLVNSLKTINDLETQLRESRIETIAARNEVNFLKLEANANKRKMTSKTFPSSSSSVQPNTDAADYSSDDDEKPLKQKHVQQRKFPPAPAYSTAASQVMPFNSRVEKAIDSVAESLVNPHANTPPKSFLFKFVCRIFDGGDLYYGYIVAFNRMHFQVVYNDGDSQRLSIKEVRLSLVDDHLVPPEIANDCKAHFQKGSFLSRSPLPTIS